jgi:hypothetical protein
VNYGDDGSVMPISTTISSISADYSPFELNTFQDDSTHFEIPGRSLNPHGCHSNIPPSFAAQYAVRFPEPLRPDSSGAPARSPPPVIGVCQETGLRLMACIARCFQLIFQCQQDFVLMAALSSFAMTAASTAAGC